MKQIGRMLGALGISLCLMGLSGCSDAALGTDSLLRPPRATGDKAEIQNIIAKEAGGSYNLKYPQTGDNRSAIIMRNENTDNEYALALYATENDTRLNASIIALVNDEWTCIGTFSNNASGVDRVVFDDISGDKKEEILIGWTNHNTTHKTLTGYSLTTEGVFEMKVDETYDEMVLADIVGDMTNDIVMLSLSSQDSPASAMLLQYSEKDKRPIGKYSMEMDPDVIGFSNMIAGKVACNVELTDQTVRSTATGAKKTAVSEKSQSASSSDTESDTNVSVGTSDEETEPSVVSDGEESVIETDEDNDDLLTDSDTDHTEESVQKSELHEPEVSVRTNSGEEEPLPSGTESSETSTDVIYNPEDIKQLSKTGIVLDCSKNDKTYCTQMVYFDKLRNELIDPLFLPGKEKNYKLNPTNRVDPIFSRDINGDSVIDIPMITSMLASAAESGANVCNQTAWVNYSASENQFPLVYNTVMNSKDGYYFIMPNRWSENVTARSDPETREMSFYLWDSGKEQLADKLLTICRLTEQQWKENTDTDLFRIEVKDAGFNAVYAAKIFEIGEDQDQEMMITREEVQRLLILL